jgi:HD-like signal output (HDOD) protein
LSFLNWIFGGWGARERSVDGDATEEQGGPRVISGESSTATLEPGQGPSPGADQESEAKWWAPQDAALTELAGIPRPTMLAEGRALENLLIGYFDGHDLTMPPMPVVAERVLRKLQDRDWTSASLATQIAEDQVIAAAVLRAANSPLYRGVNKVASLQEAVGRLGANAIRTLMMHQSLHAVTFQARGHNRRLADMLWRRSLASAHIMQGLAKLVRVDPQKAFLIGLLHDLGNVVVLRIARTEEALTRWAVDAETFEYLCFECHQEFGELVADAWNLPSYLKGLISNHHSYPGRDDPLRVERLSLHLTDMMNAMLGYAPSGNYDLIGCGASQDLGLSQQPAYHSFLDKLPEQVEQACECL